MTYLYRRLLFASPLLLGACSMDNPEFAAGSKTTKIGDTSSSNGDGDGDGDGTSGDGDGDGAPGDGDGAPGDGAPGDGDGEPGDGDGEPGDGDGDPAMCEPGQLACDGQCVGPDDNMNCGECGNPCDADLQLCHLGACLEIKHVFVSSALTNGHITELLPLEEICNAAAANASLAGDFRPWLSTQLFAPAATFDTEGVYKLPKGPVVAWSWADLVDGQLASPININEYGEMADVSPACDGGIQRAVWTGTNASGVFAGPACAAWLDGTGLLTGRVGNADATDPTWSATDCTATCENHLPVYCVQQ